MTGTNVETGTNGKKGEWRAKLALIVLAVCLVLAGGLLTKLMSDNEPTPTVITINKTGDKAPAFTISTGDVATPNATAEAIEALGGANKVKIASQKENRTTIRTVETDLIVNEENKSVNAPKDRVIAGEGITMILGNETVETKKTRSVKLIEVQTNVSKTEAQP